MEKRKKERQEQCVCGQKGTKQETVPCQRIYNLCAEKMWQIVCAHRKHSVGHGNGKHVRARKEL